MNPFAISSAAPVASSGYRLRFAPLAGHGQARAFRCDAAGRVDLDALDERERCDYLFARALVGRDFRAPAVCDETPARSYP
jgi:hypothetical protein